MVVNGILFGVMTPSDKLKVNQSDLPVCFDTDFYHCAHSSYVYTGRKEGRKEGRGCFI